MSDPLSGQVILDVGAAMEAMFPHRFPSDHKQLIDIAPEIGTGDPYLYVQWARYKQALILGEGLSQKLEQARVCLAAQYENKTPTFVMHLIRNGDDVRQVLLEESKDVTDSEISKIDWLLQLPPIQRWSALSDCIV